MYEAHFGLRRRPFRPTPDGEMYYPATGHEQAVAELQAALNGDDSACLLTGEPGTGKTILAAQLLTRPARPAGPTVYLPHAHFPTRADLLRAVLFDLRLTHAGLSEAELRLVWSEACLNASAAGERVLVVVDEADRLGTEPLDEVRLWLGLNTGPSPAVQAVLLAQPGLLKALESPDLAALRERLMVTCEVPPLGKDEAVDYLYHLLRRCGVAPDAVLTAEAAGLIADQAGCVPRRLNVVAHKAFAAAAKAGMGQVDAEAVLESIGPDGPGDDGPLPFPEPQHGKAAKPKPKPKRKAAGE